MAAGLQSAVDQLQSYGRGRDTMLAHISPDEANFIDQVQGGRRTNPMTGLPEYSLFGDILKAVVRVGASIGGFMLGGPAGAAAGAGLATKLTGGSWSDALKGAAMSGIGSLGAQGLSGGGWSLTGASGSAAGAGAGAGAGVGTAAGEAGGTGLGAALSPSISDAAASGIQGLGGGLPGSLAAASAAPSAVSTGVGMTPGFLSSLPSTAAAAAPSGLAGLGQTLAPIGGIPGAVAGLGALSSPLNSPDNSGGTPLSQGSINLNVKPLARTYQPFTGDYSKYGQSPQESGWQFYDQVNPQFQYKARGGAVRRYALGGGVLGMHQPGAGLGGGLGMLHNPAIPSQITQPSIPSQLTQLAQMHDYSPAAQRANIRQAAILGYTAAAKGGSIHGPGTGKSDSIPAMLSDGEHVFDADTVSALGDGSNDSGQEKLEQIKTEIRRRAGRKYPSKPTPKQNRTPRGLVSQVM